MQLFGGLAEILLGVLAGVWIVAEVVHSWPHHYFAYDAGLCLAGFCGVVLCLMIIGLGIATASVRD